MCVCVWLPRYPISMPVCQCTAEIICPDFCQEVKSYTFDLVYILNNEQV